MRVLVTGASGFLGREVVRGATAAGHYVFALVRPTANVDKLGWPDSVKIVRGDLRKIGDWAAQIGDVESVIHLAAATSGDLPTQFSGTVVATENLLAQLPAQALRRFVHVSSLSVYDYGSVGFGGRLTEKVQIDPMPEKRDVYTITKIAQERLVFEACEGTGVHLVVIRPGAIVGPGKDWGFGRVIRLGRRDLIFSPWATFPLTYVSNCADSIVKALEAAVASGSAYNIVDDELPTYSRFHRLGRRFGGKSVPAAIYIPWLGVRVLGATVAVVNRLAFKGSAKLPEFLDWQRQRVRWQPMKFSNQRAKQDLGWEPAVPLETAIRMTAESMATQVMHSG